MLHEAGEKQVRAQARNGPDAPRCPPGAVSRKKVTFQVKLAENDSATDRDGASAAMPWMIAATGLDITVNLTLQARLGLPVPPTSTALR